MQRRRTLFGPRPFVRAGGAPTVRPVRAAAAGRVGTWRRGRALAVTLSTAAILGACNLPDPPWVATAQEETAPPAVAPALDSVYAAFSRAYASANVQVLMDEVYAPGAYYLPPGLPILEGQDQFRGQFSFLEAYAREGGPGPDISFRIVDRDVDGDLAYDIGIYTIRSPDAPPDSEGDQGKFVVVWKRNARGEWRIHADSYSAME
jgi:ketosteroid isomerase-like protein